MVTDDDSPREGAERPTPVDVMMRIDTGALPRGAGMTLESPAEAPPGAVWMFVPRARGRSDAAGHLGIEGGAGAVLRIWASSLSDQLDDEAFLVHVADPATNRALRASFETIRAVAVVRQPGGRPDAPPVFAETAFHPTLLPVGRRPGTEKVRLTFAVYGRPDAGGARPLAGYYRHDVSITVAE